MTSSWSVRPESSSAAAALLAAAGVSAVVRGYLSLRDGQHVWTDAICRNPFDAHDQRSALGEVAAALGSLGAGVCDDMASAPDDVSTDRERIGKRMEIAWCVAQRVLIGCATSSDNGSRFVALWDRETNPAVLVQHKDLLRVALCYEMVLLGRTEAVRSTAIAAKIATQTLNSLAIPLFVIGADREIVRMNSAARKWLVSDGRLRLANRRLVGASAVLNAQLRSAIGRAFDPSCPRPVIVPLADAEDDRPVVTLSCTPIAEPEGHVLIAVQERRCDVNLAQQTLTALGLTQSERRLASFLGTGMSLQEAAASSGVTFSTARSYLKRIFGKLGIARQSDLVGLVAALTPIFLSEDAARSETAVASRGAPVSSEETIETSEEARETALFRRVSQDIYLGLSDGIVELAGRSAAPEASR